MLARSKSADMGERTCLQSNVPYSVARTSHCHSNTVMASCDAHLQQVNDVFNELDVQVVISVWGTPEVSKQGISIKLLRVYHSIAISMRKDKECLFKEWLTLVATLATLAIRVRNTRTGACPSYPM